MSIDDKLAAAAVSIASMPDAGLRAHLDDLEAEHRRRSGLAGARQSAALESIDLDWAAYQLGCKYDDEGNLDAAARWYRMAAANDFADAALRLGCVLDMLASQRTAGAGPGYGGSEREALVLVSEAARWYAEAYAAGHPEAAERLGDDQPPRP
jgi:TPR repeat protein